MTVRNGLVDAGQLIKGMAYSNAVSLLGQDAKNGIMVILWQGIPDAIHEGAHPVSHTGTRVTWLPSGECENLIYVPEEEDTEDQVVRAILRLIEA